MSQKRKQSNINKKKNNNKTERARDSHGCGDTAIDITVRKTYKHETRKKILKIKLLLSND